MNWLAPFLLAAGMDPTVQLSDLERFPASKASVQVERHWQRMGQIWEHRAIRGYEDGCWDRDMAQTRARWEYWQRLDEVQGNVLVEDEAQRRDLIRFKWWLGPERYLVGWAPPQLSALPQPKLPPENP